MKRGVTQLGPVTLRAVTIVFLCQNNFLSHVTTWRAVLPSALIRRGGGVSIMASMQVRVQLTAIAYFKMYSTYSVMCSGRFVGSFAPIQIFVRSNNDIQAKAVKTSLRWLRLALDVCLAILAPHHHQQHQVKASIEAILGIYLCVCIWTRGWSIFFPSKVWIILV